MHAKKVCNEEEEEENQLSFPHQKRLFWLSVPDARNKGTSHTELWVLLSLRQGHHVQKLPDGRFCSRENVENKSKRHCRRDTSGKLIGSKARSHARTKETLKRGGV